AEQAVLGCVLLEGRAKVPPLAADEFVLVKHQRIWAAILALVDRDEPVDAVTVLDELQRHGTLAEAGGPAELALLIEHASLRPALGACARCAGERARRRRLKELGEALRQQGFDEAEVTRRLREMPGPMVEDVFDPADVWAEIVEDGRRPVLRTGLVGLDQIAL